MNFDSGEDLHIGDVVWIKGVVETKPSIFGNVQIKYFVRPSSARYTTNTFVPISKVVNAIFLKRSKLNWLRRLLKK